MSNYLALSKDALSWVLPTPAPHEKCKVKGEGELKCKEQTWAYSLGGLKKTKTDAKLNIGGTFKVVQDAKKDYKLTVSGRLDWRQLNSPAQNKKFKLNQKNQNKTTVARPYALNDVFTTFWAFNAEYSRLPQIGEIGDVKHPPRKQVTEIVGIRRSPTANASDPKNKDKVKKEWEFFSGMINCRFSSQEQWPKKFGYKPIFPPQEYLETCFTTAPVKVNHAWDLIKLEEDDLGIKFVAERPYKGNLSKYGGFTMSRDWQQNLIDDSLQFRLKYDYKMIRMGFMEEGEIAVMTPAQEFDIYNDNKADFSKVIPVEKFIWPGLFLIALIALTVLGCFLCQKKGNKLRVPCCKKTFAGNAIVDDPEDDDDVVGTNVVVPGTADISPSGVREHGDYSEHKFVLNNEKKSEVITKAKPGNPKTTTTSSNATKSGGHPDKKKNKK